MSERATYDGDRLHLDEIVAEGVDVHIERMNVHDYMVQIWRGTELLAHLNVRDLTEVDETTGLPVRIDEPLLYCREWKDRFGTRHACTSRHSRVDRWTWHKCDCGAKRQGDRP